MINTSFRRSIVVLVLLVALASGTAAVHATPQSDGGMHTLVIEQTGNNSVGYSVSVSGKITAVDNETSDSITGQTASGRVGGLPWKNTSTDTEDEIRFTGHIRDFEHDGGNIRLILDGKQVDPSSLHNTPQGSPTLTPTTDSATPTPSTASPTHSPHSTPSSGAGDGESWLSLNFVIGLSVASVLALLFFRRV